MLDSVTVSGASSSSGMETKTFASLTSRDAGSNGRRVTEQTWHHYFLHCLGPPPPSLRMEMVLIVPLEDS